MTNHMDPISASSGAAAAGAGGQIKVTSATDAGTTGGSGYELSIAPHIGSEVRQPGFAENMTTTVYEGIDRVGVELPQLMDRPETVVNKEIEKLVPTNEAISPQSERTGSDGQEALVALSKAFDHAVFMGMVNQVVSGVSDTARTLIRQQ